MLNLIRLRDEPWDLAFIARYPTAGAFMTMVTDDERRQAVKHRQEGARGTQPRLSPGLLSAWLMVSALLFILALGP